jgi:hypothetical protein
LNEKKRERVRSRVFDGIPPTKNADFFESVSHFRDEIEDEGVKG